MVILKHFIMNTSNFDCIIMRKDCKIQRQEITKQQNIQNNNNFSNLKQMLYNSTPKSGQPQSPSGAVFMKKICDQIQQQIQQLLINLQPQQNQQINGKLLEKCISSTKVSIMKILNTRLPQIMAIQEKFKSLVLEINEQLETQKEKNKQLQSKYEEKILECDRYKMEIVQVSQIYQQSIRRKIIQKQQCPENQNQPKQHKELKNKIAGNDQPCQTQHNQYKILQTSDYDKIQHQLLQRKQQRQLYYSEIAKYHQIIQQLKSNQAMANQRIQQLLYENDKCSQIIIQQKQNAQILKNQMAKVVLELEQSKIALEEQLQRNKQELAKTNDNHNREVNQLQQVIQTCQIKIRDIKKQQEKLIEQIRQCNLNFKQRSDDMKKLQLVIKQKDQQIEILKCHLSQSSCKLGQYGETIQQLSLKVGKINNLQKFQHALQSKYTKKVQLLSQHNKQLQKKYAFAKQENERLYTAMDSYAKKQSKLIKKMRDIQNKLKHESELAHKYRQSNIKIKQVLVGVKGELHLLKKLYFCDANYNIAKIIQQFKLSMKTHMQQQEVKFTKKTKQIMQTKQQVLQQMQQKLRSSQNQLKFIQHRFLQSQMGANKISHSLLQSKNQITEQLHQKDQIIRDLQKELEREKQFNINSTQKVAQVVRKYQKFKTDCFSKQNNFLQRDQQYLQMEKQLAQQRTRLIGLQYQYKNFIKK